MTANERAADVSAGKTPETWTIESLIKWATLDFKGRGVDSPRLDAELLLAHALGATRVQLIIDGRRPLEPGELARFRDLVKRRRTREPIAYLLGQREFFGRTFQVDARVLVPRPETEALVEIALERSDHVSLSMRALDLCTGSGAVAISIARERPTAFVVASDISEDALCVAKSNAGRLGAHTVTWLRGDLFAPLPRGWRFDVITANPPYIPTGDLAGLMPEVRVFEPHLALDGGSDGLDFVRRLITEAKDWLVPGGALALEIGHGQSEATTLLFEQAGYERIEARRDYAGIPRIVVGSSPSA